MTISDYVHNTGIIVMAAIGMLTIIFGSLDDLMRRAEKLIDRYAAIVLKIRKVKQL